MRGQITKFLFEGGDYFTALTDRNAVRIGLVGAASFDVPQGHAFYQRVVDASTAAEVEALFDELYAALT